MKNHELITSKMLSYLQESKLQECIFTFLKSKELPKLLSNKNMIYNYIYIYNHSLDNVLDIINFLESISEQTYKNNKTFDLKKEEVILGDDKIYYFIFPFEHDNKIFKFKLPALTD